MTSGYHVPKKPIPEVLSKIRETFRYEPNTGHIYRSLYGKEYLVTSINNKGYLRTHINCSGTSRSYACHHIAWFLYYGSWPNFQIDHKDYNRLNNSIGNLRPATTSQNKVNCPNVKSASGIRGVRSVGKKWRSTIVVGGKQISLGHTFETKEEAAKAYIEAAKRFWGEFVNPEILGSV